MEQAKKQDTGRERAGLNFHKEIQNIMYNEIGLTKDRMAAELDVCIQNAVRQRIDKIDIECMIQEEITRKVSNAIRSLSTTNGFTTSTIMKDIATKEIQRQFQLDFDVGIKITRKGDKDGLPVSNDMPEQ